MKHIFGKKSRKQKFIPNFSIQSEKTENSKKENWGFYEVKTVKDNKLKTNGENTVCKNAFYMIKDYLFFEYGSCSFCLDAKKLKEIKNWMRCCIGMQHDTAD